MKKKLLPLAMLAGLAGAAGTSCADEILTGTAQAKIDRPADPYSELWGAFWDQNPHLKRGVGAEATDDDEEDEEDEEDDENLDPKELKKQLKAMQKSVAKLSTKNQQLLQNNSNLKTLAKDWEGLDPKQMRGLLDRINNDEELKLLSEGKHDEVIKKRTEKIESTYKARTTELETEVKTSNEKLTKAEAKLAELIIDSGVKSEFIKQKGKDTAVDDIVLRAHRAFKLEDGEPIARDKDGEIIVGKKGPLTISEWVENQQDAAPHLFLDSEGADTRGRKRGDPKLNGIDAKMAAASKSGNVAEYKRLKKIRDDALKNKE